MEEGKAHQNDFGALKATVALQAKAMWNKQIK